MFRQLFLFLSTKPALKNWVLRFQVAQALAQRFVAGDTLDEAIQVVRNLNGQGLHGMLNALGEHVESWQGIQRLVETYCEIYDRIDQAGVDTNMSVKPTQLGLHLDEDLLFDNLQQIAEHAARFGNTLEIDMEDSPGVQRTLNVYYRLREAGLDNVGTVIQAYLYRSEEDIEQLIEYEAKVRLCKGAYDEPADVAYRDKAEVNRNFVRLVEKLFSREAKEYGVLPAIASHDEQMIAATKDAVRRNGWPQHAFEFQMLYGVRTELQRTLVDEGYQVRVYVPFGSEWYPYFMRRMAERPANALLVARALLNRH